MFPLPVGDLGSPLGEVSPEPTGQRRVVLPEARLEVCSDLACIGG